MSVISLVLPMVALGFIKLAVHAATATQWTINWAITLGVGATAIWLVRRWRA